MGKIKSLLVVLAISIVFTSCGNDRKVAGSNGVVTPPAQEDKVDKPQNNTQTQEPQKVEPQKPVPVANDNSKNTQPSTPAAASSSVIVVSNPSSISVVVNKKRSLKADWKPNDLVKVAVPYRGREDAGYMRKEAADALDKLFADAKNSGIELCAVSGFRSYELQKYLFNKNVSQMGEAEARRVSAYPGQSEHQTGLAMDISSASMNYGLSQSFGKTTEGKWLKAHAAEYGFIIRYLDGKEAITGYIYEPWHLRYVGSEAAKEIMSRNITLEEYMGL